MIYKNKNILNKINKGKVPKNLSYEKIIKLFLSFDKNSQKEFIIYILKHNKITNNEIFNNFITVFETIFKKIETKEVLTNEEMNIFEIVYSEIILNDVNINYNVLNNFSTIYMDKFKKDINKVVLLSKNLINDLNEEYSKNYKIKYISYKSRNSGGYITTNIGKEDDDQTIYFNMHLFNILAKNSFKSPFRRARTLILHMTNIVLHEYKHLLQNDYILENDNNLSERYIKEKFIHFIDLNYNGERFYKSWHDDLYMEKEANSFAIENMFKYIKKYYSFNPNDIRIYKEAYRKMYFKDNINQVEFNRKINNIFEKLKNEFSEHYNNFIKNIDYKKNKMIKK